MTSPRFELLGAISHARSCRTLSSKADTDAVTAATAALQNSIMLRATHTELASVTDDTAELAAAVRTLQGALAEEQRRSSDLSAELERFKAEAQQGVIAATRAANEARQSVGAALTTLSAVQQQQPAAASSAAAAQLGGIEARVLADLADVRAQASPVEVKREGRGDGRSGMEGSGFSCA
jgi:chromosome segregation ATPase